MDANRVATLLRIVSTAPSRRRALRLLVGTTLGGFVAAVQPGAAREQPRRNRKKRNPCRGVDDDTPCAVGKRCCGGQCVDVLSATDHCSRCGIGCAGGEQCVGGSCCLATVGCAFAPPGGSCGPAPADWPGPDPGCQDFADCTGGLCPCV
jgi:hypothetical protein